LTIGKLDPGTRQWLARKGFQDDEDIEELAKLVGSLSKGLIVLVCSLPKHAHGEVCHAPYLKKKIFKGLKYSKELLTAVRELRQKKIRKNFSTCPNLEEDSYDKVPAVARINTPRQSPYWPIHGREGQEERNNESENDSEESSNEPENDLEESSNESENDSEESSNKSTSIMEVSLDVTNEPEIAITEVCDMIDSQQPDESMTGAGEKIGYYGKWLLRKLYKGGQFNPHKLFNRNQYAIGVHANTIFIYVPTWIMLDPKRSATVKVELADRNTELPEGKIFAQNDNACDTARRLGISVTVFRKDGSEVQFWAERRTMKSARHAHDLVVALEALLEETATE
jgi:hypothetical protein